MQPGSADEFFYQPLARRHFRSNKKRTPQTTSGVWYDYWTGGKIQQPPAQDGSKVAEPLIQPKLDVLSRLCEGGIDHSVQPLVQSTDEKPQGPLTLRV